MYGKVLLKIIGVFLQTLKFSGFWLFTLHGIHSIYLLEEGQSDAIPGGNVGLDGRHQLDCVRPCVGTGAKQLD
jgi:hypothetical protein